MAQYRILAPTSYIVDNEAIVNSSIGDVIDIDESTAADLLERNEVELVEPREEFEQKENHAVIAGGEAFIVDGPVTDEEVKTLAAMREEALAQAGAEAYAENLATAVPGPTGTMLDEAVITVVDASAAGQANETTTANPTETTADVTVKPAEAKVEPATTTATSRTDSKRPSSKPRSGEADGGQS